MLEIKANGAQLLRAPIIREQAAETKVIPKIVHYLNNSSVRRHVFSTKQTVSPTNTGATQTTPTPPDQRSAFT